MLGSPSFRGRSMCGGCGAGPSLVALYLPSGKNQIGMSGNSPPVIILLKITDYQAGEEVPSIIAQLIFLSHNSSNRPIAFAIMDAIMDRALGGNKMLQLWIAISAIHNCTIKCLES